MIKIEEVHNTKGNSLKAHCETCYRVLASELKGEDPIGDDAMEFMLSVAAQHLRKKKKHKVTVYIGRRLPSNREIRAGKMKE